MSVYHRPATLDEALRIYAEDPTLKILAGGTDIYPAKATRAGWGDLGHAGVLDLSRIDVLRGITETSTGWWIRPLTTWRDIIDAELPPLFDGLKAAAREVGGVQIQNRGTIGGNICNASPAADGVPPLLTMRAKIRTNFPQGERALPLNAFIDGYRHTLLLESEIMRGIEIDLQGGRGYFRKLGARKHLVISIAMVAAVFDWDERGNVKTARVVVGACSPVAQRLSALEDTLRGKPLDPSRVKLEHVAMLTPLDDVRASATYRRAAALQLVKDIVAEAAEDQRGGRT